MATLIDYAREQFPTHHVEASAPDTELTAHTVVAQVLGSHRMKSLEQRAKEALAGATIVTALVRPVHEGVVPTGAGDSEAVLDLPRSRIAALAAMVAVVAGVVVGLIVGFSSGNGWIGAISGVFAALVGALIGGLVGGGGRYGGERAWKDANAPDTTVGLIAALCVDEAGAVAAATQLEALGIDNLRVLGADGGWHLPNT